MRSPLPLRSKSSFGPAHSSGHEWPNCALDTVTTEPGQDRPPQAKTTPQEDGSSPWRGSRKVLHGPAGNYTVACARVCRDQLSSQRAVGRGECENMRLPRGEQGTERTSRTFQHAALQEGRKAAHCCPTSRPAPPGTAQQGRPWMPTPCLSSLPAILLSSAQHSAPSVLLAVLGLRILAQCPSPGPSHFWALKGHRGPCLCILTRHLSILGDSAHSVCYRRRGGSWSFRSPWSWTAVSEGQGERPDTPSLV